MTDNRDGNPLEEEETGFLTELEETQKKILLEEYKQTFSKTEIEDRVYNDYKSYVNYFLRLAGQNPINESNHQNNRSTNIKEVTKRRYADDVLDFVLFYKFYKSKINRKPFKKSPSR